MLAHLQIRDFAIIEEVELELPRGLIALTGETGAGKSIIVDAVMLALGGRASVDSLRHGAERAEIAATFEVGADTDVRRWLDEQSIAAEDGEIVLRRVVGRDGRSRQYVNGQALPAQAVRALGEFLVEIHGQQEFQSLVSRESQREILDAHGECGRVAIRVAELAREWRRLAAERDGLSSQARERSARMELLRHQADELAALRLAAGEAQSLAEERMRLAHRGRLAAAVQGALGLCYDADGADAHAQVARAAGLLRGAIALDSRLAEPLALLEETTIGLRECGARLSAYLESLDADPARQDLVERRLAAIEDLARKHRVEPPALAVKLAELSAELERLAESERAHWGLDERIAATQARYAAAATELSAARRTAARGLSSAITALMRKLGMPAGRFEIAVDDADGGDPQPGGIDRIEFRVSANPGEPTKPVARVASGGELSRISLAVQVSSARRLARTCMIFDEIDVGIGGAVAEIVGKNLRELGTHGQVLCVTHLAQVASQANHQLRVAKLADGRSSRTTVTALSAGERIEELARMLGGLQVTRKAREHAREMLSSAD